MTDMVPVATMGAIVLAAIALLISTFLWSLGLPEHYAILIGTILSITILVSVLSHRG